RPPSGRPSGACSSSGPRSSGTSPSERSRRPRRREPLGPPRRRSGVALSEDDPAGLQLVARQAPERDRYHVDTDAEVRAERFVDAPPGLGGAGELDQETDLLERPAPVHLDQDLVDLREAPDDALDRGREDVD